jgi:hypothetical protein
MLEKVKLKLTEKTTIFQPIFSLKRGPQIYKVFRDNLLVTKTYPQKIVNRNERRDFLDSPVSDSYVILSV